MRDRPRVTAREFQVISCILDGMQARDIAKTLGISVRTVKQHKQRVYMKFDIGSKWVKEVRLVWLLSGGWNDTSRTVSLP